MIFKNSGLKGSEFFYVDGTFPEGKQKLASGVAEGMMCPKIAAPVSPVVDGLRVGFVVIRYAWLGLDIYTWPPVGYTPLHRGLVSVIPAGIWR